MPERVHTARPRPRGSRLRGSRLRASLTLLVATMLAAVTAACTERLDGGAACPSLCPVREEQFRDTVIDAVAFDTTLSGWPSLGLSARLLIANRPDTLVTKAVARFDVLTTTFLPNGTGAFADITAIDSVYLRLPIDTSGRRGTESVTLEVFDVDTTASDSVAAVVSSLFRPDRRIGSMVVVPSTVGDSLRVPLDKQKVLAKIQANARLRVGLRLTGGSGQLRMIAFLSGVGAPTLMYDPSTDTTYAPILVGTSTSFDREVTADVLQAYQVYGLTDVGSPPLPAATIAVGGFPAARSYLRFAVPARIADSSTIVRADLLLTQRRSLFGNANDSVALVPLVPTATEGVTELRRVLELAADGNFAGLDTVRLVPSDSGVRALNVLALARQWPSLPAGVPRAVAFRIALEGAQPASLFFFSSEAPAALRPKLRLTYLPRSEFALP